MPPFTGLRMRDIVSRYSYAFSYPRAIVSSELNVHVIGKMEYGQPGPPYETDSHTSAIGTPSSLV